LTFKDKPLQAPPGKLAGALSNLWIEKYFWVRKVFFGKEKCRFQASGNSIILLVRSLLDA